MVLDGVDFDSTSLLKVTVSNLGGWKAHFTTYNLGNDKARELSDDAFSVWDPGLNPFWCHWVNGLHSQSIFLPLPGFLLI